MRCRSLTAGLVAGVLLLTACGDDGDDAASPDAAAQVVDGPGGDAAAGTCLEGTPDCVDADLSGGEAPPDDLPFDLEAARRDAESLLGRSEDEVLEVWGDVRVGRHGDEQLALTEDLQPGRRTIATEDDGTGTFRVVEVVLETETGPETFTAG